MCETQQNHHQFKHIEIAYIKLKWAVNLFLKLETLSLFFFVVGGGEDRGYEEKKDLDFLLQILALYICTTTYYVLGFLFLWPHTLVLRDYS